MQAEVQEEWENFTHNVTWLRKSHGLSRKEMAKLLGIGLWSLNRMERGEMPPNLGVGVLELIYRHFEIFPSALLKCRLGEGENKKQESEIVEET